VTVFATLLQLARLSAVKLVGISGKCQLFAIDKQIAHFTYVFITDITYVFNTIAAVSVCCPYKKETLKTLIKFRRGPM